MKTSEAKALAKNLRRHRWRPAPADVLQSSLDAALAERRRVDDGPQSFQARLDRLWHVFWRFKWAFALLVVGSSLAAGVSHHNRVAASRLDAVRQELIRRAGSDKLIDLVPPTVPPEENFWALPAIQACRLEPKTDEFAKYDLKKLKWHDPGLILPEFPEDGSAPDLDAWLKSAIAAGYQPPPGATVLEALRDHLSRNGRPMDELREGLRRPKSQLIPDYRTRLAAVGGDPLLVAMPTISNINATMVSLMNYARTAALCGDGERSFAAVAVVIRVAESLEDGSCGLVGGLVLTAIHHIIGRNLPHCLATNAWNEEQLSVLQSEVRRSDPMTAVRMGWLCETWLGVERIVRRPEPSAPSTDPTPLEGRQRWMEVVIALSLEGFMEDNAALYGDLMLGALGPDQPDGWLQADRGTQRMHDEFAATIDDGLLEGYWKQFSPTRIIANIQTPMISNYFVNAAKASFYRRAATLTCALMRHHLAHGADPATLDALIPKYLPAKIEDPAKPGEWLKVRREADGSLHIWSIGPDRKDDGGVEEKTAGLGGDWLWRVAVPPAK